MGNMLRIAVAGLALASLGGCVVAPPSAAYVEPGVRVVVPAPYYGPVYRPYYPHHYYGGGWGRRW